VASIHFQLIPKYVFNDYSLVDPGLIMIKWFILIFINQLSAIILLFLNYHLNYLLLYFNYLPESVQIHAKGYFQYLLLCY